MNTKKKKKKEKKIKVSIPGPAGRIEIPAQISREHIDFAVRAHDITSELEKRTPRFWIILLFPDDNEAWESYIFFLKKKQI